MSRMKDADNRLSSRLQFEIEKSSKNSKSFLSSHQIQLEKHPSDNS
jgi:hypothetical protein